MSTDFELSQIWIAVVSRHDSAGAAFSAKDFMQVNHGKAAPLKRVKPGDLGDPLFAGAYARRPDKLQSFTAIGTVKTGNPIYSHGRSFKPYRREFDSGPSRVDAPLGPLLEKAGIPPPASRTWCLPLRFGLFSNRRR